MTVALIAFAAAGDDKPVDVASADALPAARQPQAAVAPSGKIFVTFGAKNTVYCTVSADGGKTFGEPVKVGELGGLSLGMRRGPRVAAVDKAVVVTAIGGKQGGGRDGDLLAWRSTDDGKTWKGPVAVNTEADSAREGLHGMAASKDGAVYCVWLDARNKVGQVYGAVSTDGGASWTGENRLYAAPNGPICPCCEPTVAYDPKGGLHVMWRNDVKGARDMYLLNSTDNGKTWDEAAKLGDGSWLIDFCPMDGGAVAGDADGRITTIWRRKDEVYRCRPGKAEESLGVGQQGWAAVGPGGVYLAWVEPRPGKLRLLPPGEEKSVVLGDRAADPCLAGAADGRGPVIVVWEEGKPEELRLRAKVVAPRRE
jgi:hypothetical protein